MPLGAPATSIYLTGRFEDTWQHASNGAAPLCLDAAFSDLQAWVSNPQQIQCPLLAILTVWHQLLDKSEVRGGAEPQLSRAWRQRGRTNLACQVLLALLDAARAAAAAGQDDGQLASLAVLLAAEQLHAANTARQEVALCSQLTDSALRCLIRYCKLSSSLGSLPAATQQVMDHKLMVSVVQQAAKHCGSKGPEASAGSTFALVVELAYCISLRGEADEVGLKGFYELALELAGIGSVAPANKGNATALCVVTGALNSCLKFNATRGRKLILFLCHSIADGAGASLAMDLDNLCRATVSAVCEAAGKEPILASCCLKTLEHVLLTSPKAAQRRLAMELASSSLYCCGRVGVSAAGTFALLAGNHNHQLEMFLLHGLILVLLIAIYSLHEFNRACKTYLFLGP